MTAINEGTPSAGEYRREDVRRMVSVTERQLRAWEKQGLVKSGETFGFSDLLALKTLKKLRELRIAPATPATRFARWPGGHAGGGGPRPGAPGTLRAPRPEPRHGPLPVLTDFTWTK